MVGAYLLLVATAMDIFELSFLKLQLHQGRVGYVELLVHHASQ